MTMFEYMLTQKITGSILGKASRDGTAEDDSRCVRQVALYKRVFWIFMFIGLAIAGICCFFHQLTVGLFFVLFFGLIAVPGLCAQYNCLLT